ncbi:MAG: aminotransferase class I/II-fold pyridoxal phosphate-dependent enzyme [Oscillospiraceae bacterium]|nr:aminotransferase class I/II-fold pyridoxal phosphate-dependent enzyme [Oscillospiraceae bacterium]
MTDYKNILSDTVRDIKPSGIRRFFDIAQNVKGVISLGVGEPDFHTPWDIRAAAITALEKGKTVYTANAGLSELREEIASYTERKTGVKYSPDNETVVTVGGSEAIDITIRALVNPGDEVLIHEPCFVCYAPLVRLAGGVPVTITTYARDKFKLLPEQLLKNITPKTKLLILAYPNNPTGAIMTSEDLNGIAGVLKDTGIAVLSDEIYAELTYGKKHVSIASADGMKERVVMVNGFSKAFAMTGWRLGYVHAPAPIAEQILKIHQYAVMCSPTVSQYAAIAALRNCDCEVRAMVSEYNRRRRFVVSRFNEMGLRCFEPEGAFYVFPSVESTGMTSEQFCEKLIMEQKVAAVPGTAFGDCGEGFIRVSYAYSMKHLQDALERIEYVIKDTE